VFPVFVCIIGLPGCWVLQGREFLSRIRDAEGTSTQWDDIQRKLGNLPEKPPPKPTPGWVPESDQENAPKNAEWLQGKSIDELEDLEDDPLLEDDRFLEQYRYGFVMCIVSVFVFFGTLKI
jgi:hypothetical protein